MSLDDVIKPLEWVDKANIIAGGLQNPKLRNDAKKEAEKLAKDYLGKVPYQIKDDEGNFRTIKPEEFDSLQTEQKERITQGVMEVIVPYGFETATMKFAEDAEKMDSKYISPGKLASMVMNLDVREGVKTNLAKEDKDGKKNYDRMVDEYSNAVSLKGLAKRIEDNKPIGVEQEKQLNEITANGVAKKNSDDMKKKGYSDAVAQAAGKLAAIVYDGVTDRTKMLKLGISLVVKEAEKRLKKLSENYVSILDKAVGKYLAGEMKSSEMVGNGENHIPASRKAVQLLYSANADNNYSIGSREFEIAFAE